jgi:dsDNA-binding SOS-regulon protein
MSEPVEVQQLKADELRELLAEEGTSLTLEQAEQLSRFVAKVGGLDQALAALALLKDAAKAA